MAELDVFVGNYVIIDWELYSLWLSGRSVAEAITVFVRENRGMISDHHVSQDIIVSDFEDNWRLFSMLENCFLVSASSAEIGSATSTAPLQLLDASTRKKVIESYHSLDSAFCREILGRKLNSKLRKDLDEVSEKTGILVRSCRRQFDNIKKMCKAVEDISPRHYIATISRDFGLSKGLAEKYAALVFGAAFRLELSKKKLAFLTFDQVKSVSLMMVNDWGDKEFEEPDKEFKEFLASLRELKILLDREKEHRNAVISRLKKEESVTPSVITELEGNFKALTRSIVGVATTLSNNKDVKEVFVHLVEKPLEAFRAIAATKQTVDVFLKAYGDVIKDNTLMLENDHKILVGKFVRTFRPMILAIYDQ